MYFRENLIGKYSRLDERNLIYCGQLSLRYSSIRELDTRFLLMLEYVDIALSQIHNINLFKCIRLQTVIKDDTQKVFVKKHV